MEIVFFPYRINMYFSNDKVYSGVYWYLHIPTVHLALCRYIPVFRRTVPGQLSGPLNGVG